MNSVGSSFFHKRGSHLWHGFLPQFRLRGHRNSTLIFLSLNYSRPTQWPVHWFSVSFRCSFLSTSTPMHLFIDLSSIHWQLLLTIWLICADTVVGIFLYFALVLHSKQKSATLLPALYGWGNWGSQILSNLFNITQLENTQMGIVIQQSFFPVILSHLQITA